MASVFSPSGKKHPSCAETSPPHRRRTAPQSFARMRPSSFAGPRPFPAVSRASFGNPASERPAGSLTEGLRKKCINHLRHCRLPRTDTFPVPTSSPSSPASPRHHATASRRHGVTASRHSPVRHPCVFSPFTVHISLPRPSPPPSPRRSRSPPLIGPSPLPHRPSLPASVRNPPEMRNLSAPPLDTGRRYIKTYRNSQGGVQVPTGGEPPCAGQPAGAFSREKRRSGASPGPTVTVRKKENGFLASVF